MGKKSKTTSFKKHDLNRKTDKVPDSYSIRRTQKGDAPKPWHDSILTAGAVGVALYVLYIRTLHPSVPGGDSGELIVSAHELGVAHPPGYPLFTLLSKLAIIAVPLGSPAWRVNLLTATLAAAAGAILQLTVFRLTRNLAASLVTVSLFCLSQLTWSWSVTAEVFGLNNFFIALLLYLTVLFEETDCPNIKLRVAYVGSFVSGLSLCNQHTVVLYVAIIAVSVLRSLRSTWVLIPTNLCKIGLYFGLGISPYLYLPVSAYLNTARWTWGDQRTLVGFLTHLLRAEYGTFDLGKDQQGLGFLHGLKSYFAHLLNDFSFIGPGLCVPGIIAACRMWPTNRAPGLFVLMTTVYTSFFCWRANLDMNNPLFKGVVERFWMQSDIVISVLAGLGLHSALKFITKSPSSTDTTLSRYISLFLAAAVTVIQLRNFQVCDQSSNYVIRDFARSLLDSIPKNAIVLTKGDLPTNTMRYLHLCENARPDLDILDVEILSYGWSLSMIRKFYKRINFPGDKWYIRDTVLADGKQAFTFHTFLKANIDRRPVFVCIGMQDRDESWKKEFTIWPFGVCHQVAPIIKPFDPTKWAQLTGRLAEQWNYPFDGYSETSWEKVANDEMWNAKISTAFFMYQQSTSAKNSEAKLALLVNAYELYNQAIKIHRDIQYPAYWHKNFALAAEKMIHLEGHKYTQRKMCEESIKHFQLYLQLDSEDQDRPSIEAAVQALKGRLQMIKQLDKVADTTENILKRTSP